MYARDHIVIAERVSGIIAARPGALALADTEQNVRRLNLQAAYFVSVELWSLIVSSCRLDSERSHLA